MVQSTGPNLPLMMLTSGSGPGLPYELQPAAVSSGAVKEPVEQGGIQTRSLSQGEFLGICHGVGW